MYTIYGHLYTGPFNSTVKSVFEQLGQHNGNVAVHAIRTNQLVFRLLGTAEGGGGAKVDTWPPRDTSHDQFEVMNLFLRCGNDASRENLLFIIFGKTMEGTKDMNEAITFCLRVLPLIFCVSGPNNLFICLYYL